MKRYKMIEVVIGASRRGRWEIVDENDRVCAFAKTYSEGIGLLVDLNAK